MARTQNKHYTSEHVELTGLLAEFRCALEDEIDKIKRSGQSSTLLFTGRKIESQCSEHWYRFKVEYLPSLPADTPCKLIIGNDQFDVTVISFEENSITLSSKIALPDSIGQARLENGATVLMERLIKCIEDNAEKENWAGEKMLPHDGNLYSARRICSYDNLALNEANTESQNNAIISAVSNDITFIWGPPGTGKTTVIGHIIDILYKHDRSVLVVSHTNTAVDGAIEKADKNYSKNCKNNDLHYPILRIGTPTKALPDRVLLSNHVAELGKELYEQKSALEKQKSELHRRINEIIPLLAKIKWINENQFEQIQELIQSIAMYEAEIARLQQEIRTQENNLEKERIAHPEYTTYIKYSNQYAQIQEEYTSCCKQARKIESALNELSSQIDTVNDEIKKHDMYTKLRAEESNYMSVKFYRDELSKADKEIQELENEINSLCKKQINAQQIITEYKKKNAVAKLLAGRSSYTQAQEILDVANFRLPLIREKLQQKNTLKTKYGKLLEELLLLQEQIRSVLPSRSQEYWRNELLRLQSEFNQANDALDNLYYRKGLLEGELDDLQRKQQYIKTSYDIVCKCERIIRDLRAQLSEQTTVYSKIMHRCSELLAIECSRCAAFFYTPISDNLVALYNELSDLLINTKTEIEYIDTSKLQEEKEATENQLIEVFRLLDELNQKMQELEKQAIMNAKIVGATLAKTYLSSILRERKFDTVILDEASMASIPALWCASYLAEKNIVIVGDFLQLPPIVMAETPLAKKWLGTDIFYHSGMQERAKNKNTCPNNFIMLNDQFRMESDIADIANMYYGEYGGLRSHDSNPYRVADREEFYSWYPGKRTIENVHLIDTENLHAWVTGVPQGKNPSRFNCFSAAVSVDLAFKLIEKKLNMLDPINAKPVKEASVLIVAPYKPHIARINQLIDIEYSNRGFKENLNFIRAGTIHSFQGSEADIVIFDLVIDEPHHKAGLFIQNKLSGNLDGIAINNNQKKLFNVAITRAKFKLFVVGNFSFCQKKAKNNALSDLLDKLLNKDKLVKIDAKKLLPNITFTRPTSFSFDGSLSGKHIVCREESFYELFLSDIQSCKKRIIVYSPFITEARLSTLLPSFSDAINDGKQIIVVTKALDDRKKSEKSLYRLYEKALIEVGVSVLHKKGMHEKLIFVDSDAVWIGSLNALSFTGLTGEVMQRHADKNLTEEYEKLFDIQRMCDAISNPHELECPICKNEMLIRESDKGGIYWQCSSEDYSRSAAQPYPIDGIMRCECGAPYSFSMKNEPRWVCTANSKHYKKMRESDLKFEKMSALIPSKQRRDVAHYFKQKNKESGQMSML